MGPRLECTIDTLRFSRSRILRWRPSRAVASFWGALHGPSPGVQPQYIGVTNIELCHIATQTSVYPAMNPDNSAPNVRPEVLQNWKEWILKHLPVTSKLPLSPERHPWKFIPHFLGLRPAPDGLDMCIDRRLFNLQSGELGLGPAEARVGDYVCILLGARTPFVLRRYLPEALDAQHGRIDGPHDTAFTLV
ncbi:hypothetical protein LTR22_027957, partial [Elasticomyces elasticus]